MKKQNQKKPMHHQASGIIFGRAKQLRKKETPTEKKLWEYLKGKQMEGYKFRRQHPIGRYILDFYCHAKKLVIELDGGYHQEKLQQWVDEDRTKFLEEVGLHVVRFTNEEVREEMETVLKKISGILKE